jgi:hypothetical protein
VTLATIVLSFAVLVTAHLSIVVALARRAPRWRFVAALVVAPLAPYWAMKEQMYLRAGAWLAAALAYGIGRAIAV